MDFELLENLVKDKYTKDSEEFKTLVGLKEYYKEYKDEVDEESFLGLVKILVEVHDKLLPEKHNYHFLALHLVRFKTIGKWTIKEILTDRENVIKSFLTIVENSYGQIDVNLYNKS